MPFTPKMKQQIQNTSLKAFAFKSEPDEDELLLLQRNNWDFPNATFKNLRDGTKLYLVQRINPFNVASLMDSLVSSLNDGVDIDALNESLLQMGGRKKRKSRKNRKSKKNRKSIKRR